MDPLMTNREKEVFRHYLSNASKYAEFGCGGSTVWATNTPTIQSIISIESDLEFRNKIQELCPRADVRWVDVGPTKEFGHPIDTSAKDRWHMYSQQDIGSPDLILIDGRWRVACALRVALTCPDAIVLMHDFWNRPEYQVVLPYYDVLESIETLAVLKPSKSLNEFECRNLYSDYISQDN